MEGAGVGVGAAVVAAVVAVVAAAGVARFKVVVLAVVAGDCVTL